MNSSTGKAPAQKAYSDNAPVLRAHSEADDVFLPARKVWERYGVTDMTLHRWIRDERMGFPAPVYIGRFRYWKLSSLTAFERARTVKHSEAA